MPTIKLNVAPNESMNAKQAQHAGEQTVFRSSSSYFDITHAFLISGFSGVANGCSASQGLGGDDPIAGQPGCWFGLWIWVVDCPQTYSA